MPVFITSVKTGCTNSSYFHGAKLLPFRAVEQGGVPVSRVRRIACRKLHFQKPLAPKLMLASTTAVRCGTFCYSVSSSRFPTLYILAVCRRIRSFVDFMAIAAGLSVNSTWSTSLRNSGHRTLQQASVADFHQLCRILYLFFVPEPAPTSMLVYFPPNVLPSCLGSFLRLAITDKSSLLQEYFEQGASKRKILTR
jgi:hypothetical protein